MIQAGLVVSKAIERLPKSTQRKLTREGIRLQRIKRRHLLGRHPPNRSPSLRREQLDDMLGTSEIGGHDLDRSQLKGVKRLLVRLEHVAHFGLLLLC